jgi:cytochrome c2
MANLQRYFFVFSILLALLSLALIFRESRSAWLPYQQSYQSFLNDSARTAAEKNVAQQFVAGVRQDWLPDLQRADRCRSCHIGVDDPAAPASAPLASHPEIDQHPPRQFGCTICHGGEGFATRLPDAHQEMLPVRALEASCTKCHQLTDINEQAPTAAAGNELIERYNCNGCHQFADRESQKHGGPDLSGIVAKVSARWLTDWLLKPENYLEKTRMPNFLLKDAEIRALTDFLVADAEIFTPGAPFFTESAREEKLLAGMNDEALDELVDVGKVLFGRLRCLTCHKLRGRGGDLAPELGKIAIKSNRRWLNGWLKDPTLYDPQTIMPTFTLTTEERMAVVEYLLWESDVNDDDFGEDEYSAKPKTLLAADNKQQGRKLFIEKGCYNCHTLTGIGVKTDFAPSLADFGDKKISKIDFKKSNVSHTVQDYVVAKLQAPRIFGDNLKMPLFSLTPTEVGRIATVVLGQTTKIPDSFKQQNPVEPRALPLGEVGKLFAKYKCFSCHRIGANGNALAPDLTYEGSKVKRDWLISYLQKPFAIRPFLVERMPRFNMSLAEAKLLADYMVMVLRSDKIDSIITGSQDDPDYGKKLYSAKYDCQKCHTIGTDGGYFGPALDTVGARLQRQWLGLRLDNGHEIEPDSREPVLAIGDDDRDFLISFLQSLQGEKK